MIRRLLVPAQLASKLTVVALAASASLAWAPSAFAGEGSAVGKVTLTPAGSFDAKFDDVKGEAIQSGDTVKADKIVANVKSMTTGLSLRDKHGKEKYLEVGKYPEAVLSDAVGKGGKGTGKFKMHGIEKPVSGTYKISGGKLEADFPIKLSDYGISGIKYMGVGVDDNVNIHVSVPVKKQ